MPCLYTPPNHLPLTPPEYGYANSGCGMQVNQHQYVVGSRMPEKNIYAGYDAYGRKLSGFAPTQQAADYRHSYVSAQSHYPLPAPPGLHHPNGQYSHHKRASLPPPAYEDSYAPHARRESRQEQPPAEEKPTGGVSAYLDYDMDEMTEFVGLLALELVTGQSTDRLLPSYRKFVNQILSSTRLPSSTILLGMVYLRQRLDVDESNGQAVRRGQDHVYRFLTIALLLASKFLDDNTFQNKSWSEVTSLPVAEINALEKDWLAVISWKLHVDVDGTGPFSVYKNYWNSWKEGRSVKAAQPALSPIDTTYRGRSNSTYAAPGMFHGYPHTPVHSSTSEHPVQLPPVRGGRRDSGHWWSAADYSPPSAPPTGPTTPEGYYGWSTTYHRNQQPAPEYSRLPPLLPPYSQRAWGMHNHAHAPINCYCGQSAEGFYVNSYAPPITA